ncbi:MULTISPECIES: sensor histidine kinase [unclassified Novosphingobium]|uniref:sensor histidine kinase n=1 Tax=Novosphingobium TaxID=165696 RepID=UPI00146C0C8C|nr:MULTISPECIES: sensor histidine kinase [unclassified Novosphingobium]NMN05829.1 signal transduction histidine kinase [Novosphingobium sp. SG919]NMN87811.1 signal transduction histidine kinase [Novosphingobium sp. SG916]
MQSTKLTALGRDARVNRFILTLLSIGFAALLAGLGAALWTQQRNTDSERWVAHTLEVQARIGAFASKAERMETARRGRLLSDDPAFNGLFDQALASAVADLDVLQKKTLDNATQAANIRVMRQLLTDYVVAERAERGRGRKAQIALRQDFFNDPVVVHIRQIRKAADAMADEERNLLRQREATQTQNLRTFNLVLAAICLLILAVASATILLVRRTLRELRASRLELSALNLDLERLVDSRTTELQRANAEIQRFAYIVSHDLRSPLVNVMGFTAELEAATKVIARSLDDPAQPGATTPSKEDVRRAVAEDLPEAIGFIRSSTQKMDRLINAILRLSREGRRTLAPEALDLNVVVRSIADSIQHRLMETGTALTIAPLPTVTSDRTAVEQILSNLMENALKYLQPGRPGEIHISGKAVRGRAIIEVTDNGRGIDPRDHERIFDLFRRSGVQDQPGEGIGLAHVRALAYRLGGVIEVVSELGQGATFRVNLPIEWKGAESNG